MPASRPNYGLNYLSTVWCVWSDFGQINLQCRYRRGHTRNSNVLGEFSILRDPNFFFNSGSSFPSLIIKYQQQGFIGSYKAHCVINIHSCRMAGNVSTDGGGYWSHPGHNYLILGKPPSLDGLQS